MAVHTPYRDPIDALREAEARLETQRLQIERTLRFVRKEIGKLESAQRRQEAVEARRAELASRPKRPRGRPRKDGLLPGSAEAWAADLRRKQRVTRRGPPRGAS